MAERPALDEQVELDGDAVRSWRKLRRLTQGALAEKAQPVSRGHITNIERSGRVHVGRALAERIARALGVDLQQLEINHTALAEFSLALPTLPNQRSGDSSGSVLPTSPIQDFSGMLSVGREIDNFIELAPLSSDERRLVEHQLRRVAVEIISLAVALRSPNHNRNGDDDKRT